MALSPAPPSLPLSLPLPLLREKKASTSCRKEATNVKAWLGKRVRVPVYARFPCAARAPIKTTRWVREEQKKKLYPGPQTINERDVQNKAESASVQEEALAFAH